MSIKKALFFFSMVLSLHAVEFQPIHSSLQAYFENLNFEHSKQKISGKVYGIGADMHYGVSEVRFAYEYGKTKTKQPPLDDDLRVEKLFFLYKYTMSEQFALNLNYLTVLEDNIAITDGGDVYGAGVSYSPTKQWSINFTQYYTNYDDFDVYQSDLRLDYKRKFGVLKTKLTFENFFIGIDEENQNIFTENAKKSYFTSAFKFHAHYESWHFGTAAFFGKRVFAVMNEGFKLQHHAMEFDRTYVVGIGKNIAQAVVRMQYIYQRATELPSLSENVKVENIRLIFNYKF